jgi:MFS family permease
MTSGVAALVYQVCWQRMLFAAFGVDIESITIIVSAFMLGLGVGALVGGYISDRYPAQILLLFSMTEFCIGVFGFVSPQLIMNVGSITVQQSLAVIAAANFLLMLIPTALMGATLPMLVAHVTQIWGNVGFSVGILYFANTLGAAAGAAVTGFIWFNYFELNTAIYSAATLNLSVSILAWYLLGRKSDV